MPSASHLQSTPLPATDWLAAAPLPPPLVVPESLKDWQIRRPQIREVLTNLLGDLPARPARPHVEVLSRDDRGDYALEKFAFDNGSGERVRGYCFLPKSASAKQPAPAVLYCHWHGDQYDIGKEEMLLTNAVPTAPGPALARKGYVVLGIDACCFGERNGTGPDGPQQKDAAGEMSAAKFQLWFGRSLWGMMLRDDLMALDYLCSRPEVDTQRIGVTGISMGSTRAWWLMALDDRLRTAVCVACMTRCQDLIRQGMLQAHGIYYFVPGILKHFDTEAIIALSAPRPLLFMTGDQDSGSPVDGVREIGAIVEQIYRLHGETSGPHFESAIYPGVSHVYLPEMWDRTLEWFDRHLGP